MWQIIGYTLMDIKTLTKAEKRAILEKVGSKTADEVYTQEEWARIMTATHSEIRTVMQEIQEAKDEDNA
jgi:hypothetical protein